MELVFKNNENIVTNSLLVAEKFKKEHRHVLESIKNLVAENSAAKTFYQEASYENRGKNYPMFIMNRDGFSLLVMGFTGKKAFNFKLDYIEAFNKMESEISKPRSHKEVILSELRLLEENEKLQKENGRLHERTQFVDVVFKSEDLLTLSQASKSLNLDYGRNILCKKLRELGIFFKRSNEPKQEFLNRGLFRVKEKIVGKRSTGEAIITMQTYVTQKGLGFLSKELNVINSNIKKIKIEI